jgi:hypothetical protein
MSIDNATPEEWYQVVNNQSELRTLNDYIKTKQIGGNHYKTNIEPWQVFLDWGLDPWACNVIKYVQRHRKKAGKEDLEKAKHYLEYMIENYEQIGKKYYAKD